MMVSNHPDDAAEIVRRASDGEGLLSNDGASVGNLVSGDAVRSYITMATIKDKSQGLGHSRAWYSFFVSPDNYLRTVVLTDRRDHQGVLPGPARAPARHRAVDAPRHALPGRPGGDQRRPPVARDVAGHGGDVPRHAGHLHRLHRLRRDRPSLRPGARARRSTRSTASTRPSRRSCKAAEDAPRPYKFILLSDHGQSLGSTFLQRYGKTPPGRHRRPDGRGHGTPTATGSVEEWGTAQRRPDRGRPGRGRDGRHHPGRVQAVRPRTARSTSSRRPSETADERPSGRAARAGRVRLGQPRPHLLPAPDGSGHARDDRGAPGRAWSSRSPRHEGIGLLMVRSEARGTVDRRAATGVHYLDDDQVEGDRPRGARSASTPSTACGASTGWSTAGDLVAISLLDPDTDEVAAFEELIGSHGGLGGPQTHPFIMHPAEWTDRRADRRRRGGLPPDPPLARGQRDPARSTDAAQRIRRPSRRSPADPAVAPTA